MANDAPLPEQTQGLWDDAAFRLRVEQYAERRGKTVGQICLKAGLAFDYVSKKPKPGGGRNIAAVLQLARALEVDPAELMGLRPTIEIETRRAAAIANLAAHMALGYIGNTSPGIDSSELLAGLLELIRDPARKQTSVS